MHNKAKIYGQVLKEVVGRTSAQKRASVFQNFKNLVKKRGDLKLLARAVQEFKTAWENRKGKKGTVVFAKTPSSGARGSLTKALKRKGFVYEGKVDPTLIAGVEIFLGNEYVIDNTIRGKLQRLLSASISRNPH